MPTHPLRPNVLALSTVFVLVISCFYLPAPSAAQEKPVAAPKPALTVTVAPAQLVSLPIKLAANGNIAAWQEASIGTEANGLRLTDVRVNVGDRVRAGQVLAVFAAESIQADVAQARAAVAETQASATEAKANADRARSLQPTGVWSAQQINQYLTAELTARARVELAQATLASQQLRLKQTQVLAPDAGVISARMASVGAVLPAGTELFRLIRQGRLEWRAELTSAELPRLQPGALASVTAANGTTVQGRLRMVAPTVDVQTRNGLVYVDLLEAGSGTSEIKAGMFARGEFELGASPALTVPQTAMVMRDGFSHVFALQSDGRVRQIKVQAGRRQGDRIEVVSGLSAGVPVVVQGAGFLNDADLVKVVDTPAAQVPAAKASPATAPKPNLNP